jgi:hypothetical protein
MNWIALGAIGSAVTALIIFVSVILLVWQVRELRRAAYAQAYTYLANVLQDKDVRSARRVVFGLAKDLSKWTSEERLMAEKVCHTYDILGVMVRHGMVQEKVALGWKRSLMKSWCILQPLANEYRAGRPDPDLWESFEWLAERARGVSPRYQWLVKAGRWLIRWL